jgi:hypothetical protein
MTRRHLLAGVMTLTLTMPAVLAGQQKPPAPPPAPPAGGTKVAADAPPPPPQPPTRDGRARPLGPNVRVEVTFTEQRSDAAVQPKTVTVTTGDGHWGRVRSQAVSSGFGASPLNVDARPEVQPDGRVQLALNIEYADRRINEPKPVAAGPVQVVPGPTVTDVNLSQSVTVVLESGKPLTITQSADPMSDRKVTVEVKATVLKN